MTYNDLDTINSLSELQEAIKKLFTECDQRLQESKRLEKIAVFLKKEMSKIEYVYKTLHNFGEPEKFIKILERIKSSEQFLDSSHGKYQRLEEEIQGLNSFILKEKETISRVEQTIDELEQIKSLIIEKAQLVEKSSQQTLEAINDFGGAEGLEKLTAVVEELENKQQQAKTTLEKIAEKIQQYNKIQDRLNELNCLSITVRIQEEDIKLNRKNNEELIKHLVKLDENYKASNDKVEKLTKKVETLEKIIEKLIEDRQNRTAMERRLQKLEDYQNKD